MKTRESINPLPSIFFIFRVSLIWYLGTTASNDRIEFFILVSKQLIRGNAYVLGMDKNNNNFDKCNLNIQGQFPTECPNPQVLPLYDTFRKYQSVHYNISTGGNIRSPVRWLRIFGTPRERNEMVELLSCIPCSDWRLCK